MSVALGAFARQRTRTGVRVTLIAVLLVGVVGAALLSITVGASDIHIDTVWLALTGSSSSSQSVTVVQDIRLPRTVLGVLAGAALGATGVLLQGLTRNPLADPGVMGLTAGSATAVVSGAMVLGPIAASQSTWLAIVGAALAATAVYTIAARGREGATPVKLALAGAAVTAGLTAVTTGIVMRDVVALNELRFWQVGSLAGRYQEVVDTVVPFIALGLVGALLLTRSLNIFALGDDLARSLGQRILLGRVTVFATATLLCGAATAACGPIVFLGLMVPHIARALCGIDYRWVMPVSILLGAIILLLGDVAGRLVGGAGEVQVGVVLGIIGAPFFLALVRFGRAAQV